MIKVKIIFDGGFNVFMCDYVLYESKENNILFLFHGGRDRREVEICGANPTFKGKKINRIYIDDYPLYTECEGWSKC